MQRFAQSQRLNWDLEPGDQLLRKELHERFGGEKQGGISVPKGQPLILLFSTPRHVVRETTALLWSKEIHGYSDGWDPNDLEMFLYMGQGTVGNQSPLQRGNSAVIDHVRDGRDLRLFTPGSGLVQYVGRFLCDSTSPYRMLEAIDRLGKTRSVLQFRLRPMGPIVRDILPVAQP